MRLAPIALLFACGPSAAQHATQRSALTSPVRLAVCDSGIFGVMAGGQQVGHEVFTVHCGSAKIDVRVHSTMALPSMAADVQIAMSLDSLLRPGRVSVSGLVGHVPVADTLVWRGDTALFFRNGASRSIRAVGGASFVGTNFHTGLWLAAARYDLEKGGRQTIPVFPHLKLVVEPMPAPAPALSLKPGPTDWGTLRAFRLQLDNQVAAAWVEGSGRVVALIYPSNGVEAVREEEGFARAVEFVRAATERGRADLLGAGPDTAAIPGTRAEEVSIRVGRITLAGTFLIPTLQGPAPAVVLISGSGAQDRDGRITLPGLEAYRPFRDIAHALARRGVAVLRLDDRGIGRSEADVGGPAPTTWTVASDLRAAIAALRSRADIDPDRIGLLGHSEGALVALMVAANDPKLAAIALLAAPATRGDSLLRTQLEEHLASMPEMSSAAKDSARLAQGRLFASLRAGSTLDPAVEWLKAYIDLEPAAFAARVRSPVLILNGAHDRQVPSSHSRTLGGIFRARAGADVTVLVMDSLNHLLLPAPTGRVTEYANLSVQRLNPELLMLISEWFRKRFEP